MGLLQFIHAAIIGILYLLLLFKVLICDESFDFFFFQLMFFIQFNDLLLVLVDYLIIFLHPLAILLLTFPFLAIISLYYLFGFPLVLHFKCHFLGCEILCHFLYLELQIGLHDAIFCFFLLALSATTHSILQKLYSKN